MTNRPNRRERRMYLQPIEVQLAFHRRRIAELMREVSMFRINCPIDPEAISQEIGQIIWVKGDPGAEFVKVDAAT